MEFTSLIASIFYEALHDILNHLYTHYWFKGGRGSTKSSFISLVIILLIMMVPKRHAVIFRKVGDTLRDSVYSQMLWAIQALGVSEYWEPKVSPITLTYLPNGNKIVFRGVDDTVKIKSIKAPDGYFAYIWFEELAEFSCMDEINSILQSTMRGGDDFYCFYSYNPPESMHSWVNAECVTDRPDRKVYHSTYLDVPPDWLGEPFITEAEHAKKTKPDKYRHQYLGEVIGTGGEVFSNVKALSMSDELIAGFDNIRAGLDWGWSIDPLAYVEYHRDTRRKTLYIYHEFYGLNISNEKVANHIRGRNLPRTCVVKADSAEGKSISDLRGKGVAIAPCTKGKGSRERTMRWLTEEIDTIYIDPARCPNTYREFTGYELEKDRQGNFKSEFPDKNDHTIDAVRYGEDDLNKGYIKSGRSNLY